MTDWISHSLQHDPIVAGSAIRETCVRCGRAKLTRPDGTSYGSACDTSCVASIGDVGVHRGQPPDGNPYTKREGENLSHVLGDERVAALRAFRDGRDTTTYTFWYAPVGGGAFQLTTPTQISWRGMSR